MLLLCFFALARATDLGGVGPKDSSFLPRTQKTPSGPAEEEPVAGTTAQNVPATPAPVMEDPVPAAPVMEDPVLLATDGTPGPVEVQEPSSVVPAPPGNQTR